LRVKAGEGRREWCFDFVHGTAKRERERERKEKPSPGTRIQQRNSCDGKATYTCYYVLIFHRILPEY
jgi:hypothetical protein